MLYQTASVRVAGTGSYVPDTIVTNAELEKRVGTNADWIFENLGVRERRIAGDHELTSDLALRASRAALDDAAMEADEVGLIIVATSTPDRLAPSTACILQEKLGIANGSAAFDLAAVCSGFIYAMTVAAHMISSGMYANALVVGADTFSRITDWTRRDAVFFGDGAGAAVLRRSDDPRALFSSVLYADGRGQDGFTVRRGEPHFSMMRRQVYDTATLVLPAALETVIRESGYTVEDVHCLIPHQASIRILQKTAELIGMPFERVKTNMDRYANTSAATIPLVLDEVNRAGQLAPGDLVALAAVGGGWTWGAGLLRWL